MLHAGSVPIPSDQTGNSGSSSADTSLAGHVMCPPEFQLCQVLNRVPRQLRIGLEVAGAASSKAIIALTGDIARNYTDKERSHRNSICSYPAVALREFSATVILRLSLSGVQLLVIPRDKWRDQSLKVNRQVAKFRRTGKPTCNFIERNSFMFQLIFGPPLLSCHLIPNCQ